MLKKTRRILAILLCFVFVPYSWVVGLLYLSLGVMDLWVATENAALRSALGVPGPEQTVPESSFQQIIEFVSVQYGFAVLLLGGLQLGSGIALFTKKSTPIIGGLLLLTALAWAGTVIYGLGVNLWQNYVLVPDTLRFFMAGVQLIVAAGVFCFAIVMLGTTRLNQRQGDFREP